jgi:hypothetical protein
MSCRPTPSSLCSNGSCKPPITLAKSRHAHSPFKRNSGYNCAQDAELLLQRNACDDLRAQVQHCQCRHPTCVLTPRAARVCNQQRPHGSPGARSCDTGRCHSTAAGHAPAPCPIVASHTSHVTRHTSHVTRHTSHVTRHAQAERQSHADTQEKLRLKSVSHAALVSDLKHLKELATQSRQAVFSQDNKL